MKFEKSKERIAEEESWDFDFSEYEKEESKNMEKAESIVSLPRAKVTPYRARFSNWEQVYLNLGNIERDVSKKAILVAANSQKISDLWDFYAIVNEYWENIKDMYGDVIHKELEIVKSNCVKLLQKYHHGKIPYKVHAYLMKFRGYVFRLAQMGNLRFDVDITRKAAWADKISQ